VAAEQPKPQQLDAKPSTPKQKPMDASEQAKAAVAAPAAAGGDKTKETTKASKAGAGADKEQQRAQLNGKHAMDERADESSATSAPKRGVKRPASQVDGEDDQAVLSAVEAALAAKGGPMSVKKLRKLVDARVPGGADAEALLQALATCGARVSARVAEDA
jgi:hypothetical protein